MLMVARCPRCGKDLVFFKDTATHSLFKCPDCDYIDYPGGVRSDLPERFDQLQAELEQHRWIPVSEGLPENKKEIEFCVQQHSGNRFIDIGYYENCTDYIHTFFGKQGQYVTRVVTHWRLIILPEKALKETENADNL